MSAVTGVFTKDKSSVNIKYGERSRAIYPAISYWVVLDGESESGAYNDDLFRQLREANPLASLKYIVTVQSDTPGTNLQSLDTMAAPLFVTLKDHNDNFTQRKVEASAQHLSLGLSDTAIAKLVVVDVVGCGRQLHEVWVGLCAQKLQLEFDISPPGDDIDDAGLSSQHHKTSI